MIAPASENLAREFGIINTIIIALITSVFVLGYAIGPLFLGPLSEIYGRSRVLQWSNLWYLGINSFTGTIVVKWIHFISFSVEHGLWIFSEQRTIDCFQIPSRNRRERPHVNWWRCRRRLLEDGTERSSNGNILISATAWSSRRSSMRCLDRREDHLEMGILVDKHCRCYDPIFWIFLLG
jgi:hypothetical protein